MKKVFLDCGAHCGCSIRCFNSIVPNAGEWEKYSFEPNPNLWKYFERLDSILIKEAIWNENKELDFWVVDDTRSSSTLNFYKSHRPTNHLPMDKVKVKSRDLSRFIRQICEPSDFIFLKLDIECAEYVVLDHLIQDKTIHYINIFSGEFHNTKCNVSIDEDKRLQNMLNVRGIEFIEWDAMTYCVSPLIEPEHVYNKKYCKIMNNMIKYWRQQDAYNAIK